MLGLLGSRAKLKCDLSKCIIPSSARFRDPSRIMICAYVRIGQKCYIDGAGKVFIGSGTTFAEGVTVLSSNHNFKSPKLLPFDTLENYKKVEIGDACWLGHNSIVLPGTTIQDNVILAAGSVARGVLYENGVYAGNPAIRVAEREISLSNELENYIQYKAITGDILR